MTVNYIFDPSEIESYIKWLMLQLATNTPRSVKRVYEKSTDSQTVPNPLKEAIESCGGSFDAGIASLAASIAANETLGKHARNAELLYEELLEHDVDDRDDLESQIRGCQEDLFEDFVRLCGMEDILTFDYLTTEMFRHNLIDRILKHKFI